MKRKLIAFSTTMALLLSVFSAANVGATLQYIESKPQPSRPAALIGSASRATARASALFSAMPASRANISSTTQARISA